jgi:membrane associated rhomboid family serine protease
MGALDRGLIRDGEYWRLVTPMFLHAGLLHIGFNMFALYQLGILVEQAFGRGRYLVLYLLCGITGSLASYFFSPGGFSVGASGAICGFLGVMAAWGKRRGGHIGETVKRVMIRWAIFILIFGLLAPNVDNAAHAGGFAGGLALAFLISPKGFKSETALRRRLWNAAAAGAVLVFLVCGIAAGANVVHQKRVREMQPAIQSLGIALDRAWSSLERSYEHVPETGGLVPEDVRQGVVNLLDVEEKRLEEADPSLGGDADRAVALTRRALRVRREEIESLGTERAGPAESAVDLAREAGRAWRTFRQEHRASVLRRSP